MRFHRHSVSFRSSETGGFQVELWNCSLVERLPVHFWHWNAQLASLERCYGTHDVAGDLALMDALSLKEDTQKSRCLKQERTWACIIDTWWHMISHNKSISACFLLCFRLFSVQKCHISINHRRTVPGNKDRLTSDQEPPDFLYVHQWIWGYQSFMDPNVFMWPYGIIDPTKAAMHNDATTTSPVDLRPFCSHMHMRHHHAKSVSQKNLIKYQMCPDSLAGDGCTLLTGLVSLLLRPCHDFVFLQCFLSPFVRWLWIRRTSFL